MWRQMYDSLEIKRLNKLVENESEGIQNGNRISKLQRICKWIFEYPTVYIINNLLYNHI